MRKPAPGLAGRSPIERLFAPSRLLGFSAGALSGLAQVGSAALLFSPEALACLNLSDFARGTATGWPSRCASCSGCLPSGSCFFDRASHNP